MHLDQIRVGLVLLCFFFSIFIYGQSQDPYNIDFQKTYEKRISQSHLNGYYIPQDVEDAMHELDRLVDDISKNKFKSVSEPEAVKRLHFSFGRWIIVNWGFYEGSRLSHYLKQKGISYPDDMASVLMTCFHRTLNEVELGFEDMAKYYAEKRKKEMEERLLQGEVLETIKIKKSK